MQTIRACFGIGRGGRAKIAPFVLAGLAILPAVLAVGFAALAAQAGPAGGAIEDASPIRYASYHGIVGILIMLFCAAQAPELFGRDQRYGVLPLYFSRVLTRTDYALAKVGGLIAALLAVELSPYIILFVGRVLRRPRPGRRPQRRDRRRARASCSRACWSPGCSAGWPASSPPTRRAVPTRRPRSSRCSSSRRSSWRSSAASRARTSRRIVVFLSPADILDGTNAAIFGSIPDSPVVASLDLPGWAYLVAAASASSARSA